MRIISLCPSLTELVFDLGAGDSLIGRTKFCIYPADRVQEVEKLGGTKNPRIERIVQLAPDVVLLNEEENRFEDAEALSSAGVHCHVSFPKDAADTARMVREIGAEIQRSTDAERIALEIEARAARVSRNAEGRAPVSYAYLIWRDPWMVAGADTFVSGILGLTGARNVFSGKAARYPEITPAELSDSKAEAVFLSSEPFPFKEEHAAELAERSGLPRACIHFVDGEFLSWHGSRTPAGIDYAEQVVAAVVAARG